MAIALFEVGVHQRTASGFVGAVDGQYLLPPAGRAQELEVSLLEASAMRLGPLRIAIFRQQIARKQPKRQFIPALIGECPARFAFKLFGVDLQLALGPELEHAGAGGDCIHDSQRAPRVVDRLAQVRGGGIRS